MAIEVEGVAALAEVAASMGLPLARGRMDYRIDQNA